MMEGYGLSVMKLLYVSQFYQPEAIAAAFRASEHARIWQHEGVDVTVFTGYPNYPTGKIFDGYTPKLLTEDRLDGIRVLRSKLTAVPNTNLWNRLRNALSFFFYGFINLVFRSKKIGKGFDLVLGTSGIIFAALLGWIYAALHKIPFVFELRDITYLQLQATGKSKKSFSVKAMRSLELFLCRRATKVVVVTQGFRDVLEAEGIDPGKICVVTNGVDVEPTLRTEQEQFTLSYFGTLGVSQNIPDTFPLAMKIAEHCPEFEYLIIGEGAHREQIKESIPALSPIRMLPGMDAEELEDYYRLTELSVVTLKKNDAFRYTLPSKLFQIMGRGIAVLFIGPEGEAAQIIRGNRAGIALTGTPEEDLAVLDSFFSAPDWREQLRLMGGNGADAVVRHYTRSGCARRLLSHLEELVMPCEPK